MKFVKMRKKKISQKNKIDELELMILSSEKLINFRYLFFIYRYLSILKKVKKNIKFLRENNVRKPDYLFLF